jgi:hypothetical protein
MVEEKAENGKRKAERRAGQDARRNKEDREDDRSMVINSEMNIGRSKNRCGGCE